MPKENDWELEIFSYKKMRRAKKMSFMSFFLLKICRITDFINPKFLDPLQTDLSVVCIPSV